MSWACPVCTFLNHPELSSCEMCGAPAPNSFEPPPSERWEWQDAANQWHPYPNEVLCMLQTGGKHVYTAVSGTTYCVDTTTKTQTNKTTGQTRPCRRLCNDDGWICGSCTYINPSSNQCEMCDAPRGPSAEPLLAGATPSPLDSPPAKPQMALLVAQLHSAVGQSRSGLYDRPTLLTTISDLYANIEHPTQDRPAPRCVDSQHCVVCYSEFDEAETIAAKLPDNCGGKRLVCCGCLTQYIQSRVHEGDVVPWVPTPAEGNLTPLPPEVLAMCPDQVLCELSIGHISRLLARESDWMACASQNCSFGFVVCSSGKQRLACAACGTEQVVSRNAMDTDEELQQLVRDGVVRLCPSCGDPNMKDYGICNVIQCAKCSIWWNWESRETGNSSRELKAKARRAGTLWLPGELAFQQNLERTDKTAFKALLEKNGVQYDPSYHRGGH